MNKENKNYCGSCCYMLGEDLYGFGICPHRFAELVNCEDKACHRFISTDEVRRSAAMLLRSTKHEGYTEEINEAISVIARYVNVMTKQ